MTFTDSSNIQVGTIVEWRWNIDNGAQIIVNNTNAPITYTFNTPGAHTVSLTVKSNSGCNSFAFTLPITVHPLPVVNFNLPGVCLPSGFAQFYDSTTIADNTPLASYFWDFGDGSTSTLRNPTHNFASAGPFTIKHIVTSNNGCIDSATKVLNTIYQQPVAQFSAANELCERQSFNFTDQSTVQGSTVNQWYWSFGDGSTSTQQNNIKLYATPQTYTVKLLVKSVQGCPSDTLTRTVTLNPLPLATFNIDAPNCETRNSVFNNTSTMNVGTLAAAWWNYGDASTGNSTAASHPHTYANIGPYVVRLAVQNSKGCNSDTVSRNITISNLPRPNFILPEVCLSDSYAEFLDSTWIPNGNGPFTYSWNFGDPINSTPPNPNTSTQQNPRHRYSAVGQYNVKLVATSPTGCQDSLTKVITVNGAIPLANFTVNNPTALCSNLPISIVNTSTVDFGNITKVTVDFDAASPLSIDTTDETPSPGSVYTFKYPDFQSPLTRTFTISFKAFSGGTCVNERRINVTVNASPKVRFSTVPGICLDASPRQMVQAVETGNVPGTGVFTGTGVSNTGLFTPSSTTPGTYTIKYLYTSNQGCKDSASNTITVWPSPTANFLFSSPSCEQRDITFTDLSVPNYSNISQWQWDFGDGTTQNRTSAAPFAKRFAAVGTYTVRLRVVTDSGCRSNPLPTDVSVNPIPVVDFVMPQICLPSGTGTFVDSSTISDGTQAQFTYRWDFGDGSIGVGRTPTHRYTSTGPFNVTLRVTSNRGCDTTRTKVFNNILPQPTAQFDVDSVGVCLGGQFTFSDRSNGRTSTIREWNWNYDDGNGIDIRTNPNPFTKRLNIARTYNVSLFFFNQQGCVSDTFVLPVTVHPFPVVDAGPDQFVLEGGTAIFEPVATGNELRYRWTPPIYLINGTDSIAKAVCRPDNDQYYLLTVTGRGGCADTSGLFVKVLRAPKIPNAFSPNGDGVNDTWVIELLDTYPGCEIDVFNRYGQVVYHAIGYKRPWDGKMNGKDDLPVGTYYYVIQPKNKRPPIKGSVTILR
jgi:gliding motility-associated-like protein